MEHPLRPEEKSKLLSIPIATTNSAIADSVEDNMAYD